VLSRRLFLTGALTKAAGRMTKASTAPSEDVADVDTFVPDPQVWKELGISSMTGWRWQRDPDLNFPPRIQIRGRNFRSRNQLERWKAEMLRRSIGGHSKAATAGEAEK
jgi:predicted DNA-binding transcriptional regulator AlpA